MSALLKNYTEIFGVSGCEDVVRNRILSDIKPYITSYEIDSMGNLVTYKNAGKDKKTIILSAHMDEVGLIVTGITKEGMLKFDTVGGIDESVLVSKKVCSGNIHGVIGIKPFHHCSNNHHRYKSESHHHSWPKHEAGRLSSYGRDYKEP